MAGSDMDKRIIPMEVWSTGLDRWDPAAVSPREVIEFTDWHEKTVNGVGYDFGRDPLGRWFRVVHVYIPGPTEDDQEQS
jgi:hypothetical protein